jgi:hypothetical protein
MEALSRVLIAPLRAQQGFHELQPRSSIGNNRNIRTFGLCILFDHHSSEPDEYFPELLEVSDIKKDIIRKSFTPSVTSILTISAPQMLLSSSMGMLLIALDVYFGFLWVRSLDSNTGINDSRNVFISCLVGLTVAGLVYNISQLVQGSDNHYEIQILKTYLNKCVVDNPQVVEGWGVQAKFVEGNLVFSTRNSITQTDVRASRHDAGIQNAAQQTRSNSV